MNMFCSESLGWPASQEISSYNGSEALEKPLHVPVYAVSIPDEFHAPAPPLTQRVEDASNPVLPNKRVRKRKKDSDSSDFTEGKVTKPKKSPEQRKEENRLSAKASRVRQKQLVEDLTNANEDLALQNQEQLKTIEKMQAIIDQHQKQIKAYEAEFAQAKDENNNLKLERAILKTLNASAVPPTYETLQPEFEVSFSVGLQSQFETEYLRSRVLSLEAELANSKAENEAFRVEAEKFSDAVDMKKVIESLFPSFPTELPKIPASLLSDRVSSSIPA